MDLLILLLLLEIARKIEAITEQAYNRIQTLLAIVLIGLVAILLGMLLTSCSTDPLTDIPKYRHIGTAELPGLEPDGHLRQSEAIDAGYIHRNGQWISPSRTDNDKDLARRALDRE